MTSPLRQPRSDKVGRQLGAHARRAVREAIGLCLSAGEIGKILEGLDLTDLVPPHAGEDPLEYGSRAASEIMVRYLIA